MHPQTATVLATVLSMLMGAASTAAAAAAAEEEVDSELGKGKRDRVTLSRTMVHVQEVMSVTLVTT